ncbi:MAG TPA: LppX_LprAFG lipoprotein [Candidatus Dormibacteraeota bacterium]|jgi:lipoprotein LprG|nr:LppX_LprAFG lipoprotein [Candidatus Dormibacteraeota bacterium]
MTSPARPLLGLAVALACAACGSGGSGGSAPDAATLLRQGKAAVDATSALHFTLSSAGVPSSASGTYITSGDGDAVRPDAVRGTLQVVVQGLPLHISIVSVHGVFAVKLPFTNGYQATDPSKYGFTDPGRLLDPGSGLSSLINGAHGSSYAGRDRVNGEELDEVKVTLPGRSVADLLSSADASQDVQGRIGMVPSSHQVRRVELTGPFFDAHRSSTYTLILDRYGEGVQITPAAG